MGPVLFLAFLAWWAVSWRGDAIDRICWWTSLPLLILGVIAAGEANWAAPAALGPVIGLARRGGRWRRVAWAGTGVGALLSGVVLASCS